GTVTAFSPFDARADAEALRKAMKTPAEVQNIK
uniref:Anchorin CII n=1 Tax=Bos taurus TaxID=9913 RepID=Q7M3A7_BOVIN